MLNTVPESLSDFCSVQTSVPVVMGVRKSGESSQFLVGMMKKPSAFHRDTYSDRSGSSSPDSEITELKFPSINHD